MINAICLNRQPLLLLDLLYFFFFFNTPNGQRSLRKLNLKQDIYHNISDIFSNKRMKQIINNRYLNPWPLIF